MAEPRVNWSNPREAEAELRRRGFRLLPPGYSYPPPPEVGDAVELRRRAHGAYAGHVVASGNGTVVVELDELLPGEDKPRRINLMSETLASTFHQEWTLVWERDPRPSAP